MNRRHALSAAVLLFALASNGLASAGTLEFVNREHDAGRLQHGDAIDIDFVVDNGTDRAVNITAVRPQCGCTVADFTPVIEAGEQGVIHAHVDTKTLEPGKTMKSITVNTDMPGSERVILEIKMDIFAPLEFLPRGTVFMRSEPGEQQVEKRLIRPHVDGLAIQEVVSSNPVFELEIEPAEASGAAGGEAGKGPKILPRDGDYWLSVILPADAPEGVHRADVTLRTSSPDYPEGKLKVNAVVRSR
jgi:hypothetical protein